MKNLIINKNKRATFGVHGHVIPAEKPCVGEQTPVANKDGLVRITAAGRRRGMSRMV